MDVDVFELLEGHGVDLTEIRAWVPAYFPFTMGGDVWRPGGAKVPCDRPIQVGEFFICQINGPDGATAVCELTTGGVVGVSLDEVKADIEDAYKRGDLTMMRGQIAEAREKWLSRGFTDLGADEFWCRMLKARETTELADAPVCEGV